ncbi:MAG: NAD(P)-dependent oxidoreductase [Candidatus Marinimicrobia bacterium]|nr:NAD(P)-dependent oxidoreductase [Candidatus Neomarinimicrobiota bacterium]MBL7022506.1 NAD(P)-dependent oxidoreductase [Candidatus Neomarinimicrobiota bacterium]MBL7108639.1 NAD(P)-dependent oxidoreductase [Candidatus Neomarinimicrobiota bacterium]
MTHNLPVIILTGASGFVGRNLLELIKEDYTIFAFARRSQQEVGVTPHKNIKWILVDIGEKKQLSNIIKNIKEKQEVDFIIHLAAYYNFSNEPHPEYERTNVLGTKLMLEQAKILDVKRFIFSSSVAICEFPPEGKSLNEHSLADANFPYAITKKRGEKLVREYSKYFPCSIVRFAAVFSDWCEYPPLYIFLNTWFAKKWDSKILGGKGQSAVPYIHTNCLGYLLQIILNKTDELPSIDTYIASPDGSTSHRELFELSTRLFFGNAPKPFLMPITIAAIGIYLQYYFGKMIGKLPFERPWMVGYIDKKLSVDSSYTRKVLEWKPKVRHTIERRLLYLIEHSKSLPSEWHTRNTLALERYTTDRPNLVIAENMQRIQKMVSERIFKALTSPEYREKYPHYTGMDPKNLKWYLDIYYNQLITSVRTGDRMTLVNYAKFLANIRSREGFQQEEVCNALEEIGAHIVNGLLEISALQKHELLIHDTIDLTIQMAVDEILDSYERIHKFQKKI